jgi:hypothetical protein
VSKGSRGLVPKSVPIEPVSPELVLIDPELAARVRSLEPAPLWVAAPRAADAWIVAPTRHRPSIRRAYFAVAWAAAVLSPVAALASIWQAHHDEVSTAAEPLAADRAVERALPATIPAALATHPELRAVIDRTTGLVRTRTTITCRVRFVGAFWCTLRAPQGGQATVPVRRTTDGIAIMSG